MVELTPAAEDSLTAPDPGQGDDLIERGSLVLLHGPQGSGKTLTACSIVYHQTKGWKWRAWRTQPGTAVYICPGGRQSIVRRLRALAEAHDSDLDPSLLITDHDAILDHVPLVQELASAASKGGAIETIVLDYGHVFGVGADELSNLGANLKQETGASVLVLYEHTLPDHLASAWDARWRFERSVNDLIVLAVEHVRERNTLGQLAFHVSAVGGSAVLVPTSARPVLRPRLTTTLQLIFDALQMAATKANDYTLDESEFISLVLSLDLQALQGKSIKHVHQAIGRWREQLVKHRLVRWHNKLLTIHPTWRHVRRFQDLDPMVAEKLAEKMAENSRL